MQQEANKRLGYRTRRTMSIAQQLYEGISLGKQGTVGLITYMRTDSKRTSPVANKRLLSFCMKNYGAEFAAKSQRHFKNQEGRTRCSRGPFAQHLYIAHRSH